MTTSVKPLSEMFKFLPKSNVKAGEGEDVGVYPFFTCSSIQNKYYSEALYSGKCLIFGTGGNATLHYIDGNFATSTDCLVATVKNDVNEKYVYYYLFANMSILERGFKGSGLKHISKAYINDISIPFPAKAIQDRIVAAVDVALALINKRKEQIALLEKMTADLFHEMFGDLQKNPYHWPIIKLHNACQIIVDCPHSTPDYTDENTGYYCIKTGDIRPKYIKWDSVEYLHEASFLQRIKRYKPRKNDVVYSREGAIYGVAALIDRECNIALGQRMMLFSLEKKVCDYRFFYYQMNSSYIFSQAEKRVMGSASPHINVGDIKNFSFALPPIDLQTKFSKAIETCESLKNYLQESLAELESVYKSTLQKAFNGELFN